MFEPLKFYCIYTGEIINDRFNYGNRADPDEMAHTEPSHLDQRCLKSFKVFVGQADRNESLCTISDGRPCVQRMKSPVIN